MLAMSESTPSRVFMFDSSDHEMERACESARDNFRYFWREVSWEGRRIIPALDLACVKAPFSDGDPERSDDDTPRVEHMWFSQVDFDGRTVSGVLLNEPNWLKSVKQGDPVSTPLGEISDWMYVIGGEVFGAYTVNLMRSRMGRRERQEHDAAWGLNFGDPSKIRVAPESNKGGGLLKRWFGASRANTEEHPMSEAMAESLKEEVAKDPSLVSAKDEKGWTLLHQQALAGSAATVRVLLDGGADRNALTDQGMTPLQLAELLGWDHVAAMLKSK
jgi:uncharacterized protein YegJ (DUF2314 family)